MASLLTDINSTIWRVQVATESRDNIPPALKVLYPPFSNAPEDLENWTPQATSFLREANTASSFHQPNTIRVRDTTLFLGAVDAYLSNEEHVSGLQRNAPSRFIGDNPFHTAGASVSEPTGILLAVVSIADL